MTDVEIIKAWIDRPTSMEEMADDLVKLKATLHRAVGELDFYGRLDSSERKLRPHLYHGEPALESLASIRKTLGIEQEKRDGKA